MNLKSRISNIEKRMGVSDGADFSLIRVNSVSPNGSPKDGLVAAWFVKGPLAEREFHRKPSETPHEFDQRVSDMEVAS